MKTISQLLSERRAERIGARVRKAAPVILLVSLGVIAALVIGAAITDAAIMASEAEARAYCEGAVCGGPEW